MITQKNENTDVGFTSSMVYLKKFIYKPDDTRILTKDLVAYHYDKKITVKEGFITDGASVPRLGWRVVGHPWSSYLPAAIIHDALYAFHLTTREEADQIFYDLMISIGVSKWKAKIMHKAVRIFGSKPYNDDRQMAAILNPNDYLEIK